MTSDRARELRAGLVEQAERTYGQLIELSNDTTPERCDRMVRELHQVSDVCRQLRGELTQSDPPTV